MPTATEFTALGAGNGFPFCPLSYDLKPEIDNGDIDKWTTFSGHQLTTAPTQQSIDESFINAMKLYWNISGVDFDGSSNYPSGSTTANGINALNEPNGRVCTAENEQEIYGSGLSRITAGYIANKNTIQKLYYGDIFLGYGSDVSVVLLGNLDGLFFAASSFVEPSVNINLMGGSGTGTSGRVTASAVVDIDGIFFVCHTSCLSSNTNINLDPSNLQASASSSGTGAATVSFDINGLNFYTY